MCGSVFKKNNQRQQNSQEKTGLKGRGVLVAHIFKWEGGGVECKYPCLVTSNLFENSRFVYAYFSFKKYELFPPILTFCHENPLLCLNSTISFFEFESDKDDLYFMLQFLAPLVNILRLH